MVVKVAWNLRAGIPFLLFFSEGGGRGQEERSGEGVGELDSKKWPWLQIESEMLLGLRFDSSWELRIFFGPRSWQDEKHLSLVITNW